MRGFFYLGVDDFIKNDAVGNALMSIIPRQGEKFMFPGEVDRQKPRIVQHVIYEENTVHIIVSPKTNNALR